MPPAAATTTITTIITTTAATAATTAAAGIDTSTAEAERIVQFSQVFDLSGTICICHQYKLTAGALHSSPHCAAFANILRKTKEADCRVFQHVVLNGRGSIVRAAVVNNNYFKGPTPAFTMQK
jgi:hypothetical protein